MRWRIDGHLPTTKELAWQLDGNSFTQMIKLLTDGKLYVIDNELFRISIFNADVGFIESIKAESRYQDIIRTKKGNIYFSQAHSFQKDKYDTTGKLVNSFAKKWDLDFNFYPASYFSLTILSQKTHPTSSHLPKKNHFKRADIFAFSCLCRYSKK